MNSSPLHGSGIIIITACGNERPERVSISRALSNMPESLPSVSITGMILLRSESKLFGSDLNKIMPVIDTDGSDSGMFDNALEMLTLSGRSLPHAVMMMIPEPWSGDEFMSEEKRAFYEYHSCLMEPWDGPASIAFTDGL